MSKLLLYFTAGIVLALVGCSSNPEKAKQLLAESSQASLREALDQAEERHLSVKPPVPVHVLYLTAWVDEGGTLRFAPDVYALDGAQRAALDRSQGRREGPAVDHRGAAQVGHQHQRELGCSL